LRVCAIIPAFNEEATIANIIKETNKYVDFVVVVDDASTDMTAQIAQQNGAYVVHRQTNHGPGTALQILHENTKLGEYYYTDFSYIVQVDADGQHDPNYIPEMLRVAQSCDIVIGSRFLNASHKDHPFIRKIGIPFFSLIVSMLTITKLTDITSGFRVYNTNSLKKLTKISTRHWAIEQTTEALKKGLKVKEVSVVMPVRTTGKSQFTIATYTRYPFKMLWTIIRVFFFK
jgi:glycosyltransferase involved in cell wall biosynthesis